MTVNKVWNEIIFNEEPNAWELVKTTNNNRGGKTFTYKHKSGETLKVYLGGDSYPWKLVFEK